MRFFSGVHPLVDRECRSLDEPLPTTWMVTDMWPMTCVDPLCKLKLATTLRDQLKEAPTMPSKIASAGKALSTIAAVVCLCCLLRVVHSRIWPANHLPWHPKLKTC
jgi:hypothetical protein